MHLVCTRAALQWRAHPRIHSRAVANKEFDTHLATKLVQRIQDLCRRLARRTEGGQVWELLQGLD
jgi:hypothetical protein